MFSFKRKQIKAPSAQQKAVYSALMGMDSVIKTAAQDSRKETEVSFKEFSDTDLLKMYSAAATANTVLIESLLNKQSSTLCDSAMVLEPTDNIMIYVINKKKLRDKMSFRPGLKAELAKRGLCDTTIDFM